MTRRDALMRMLAGGAGLAFAPHLFPRALAGGGAPPRTAAAPRAKAVIQIWMWGGACHIDTFDPKPEAGYDVSGPLSKAIPTSADGVRFNASLPMLAKEADKLAVIRSMTHGVNGHETASYIVQAGHTPGRERIVYPSVGAVVSMLKGHDPGRGPRVPPYVVLTEPLGRFSETGFLDLRHKPFVTGGDPNQKRFAVEGIVAEGISDERQRARRGLLHDLDALGRAVPRCEELARLDRCEEEAYELILGDAGKVFDVSREKDAVRDRYGRNKLGQSCLAARRLVEEGASFVSINSAGWDTHKSHFEAMNRKLPELDRAMSALVADLAERGLLDSTIVWWGGEFGRTPAVQWEEPWNGGRGHHGRCFSAVVAGGGFTGGRVVGASDAKGMDVRERPVHPRDLIAAMYGLLGIDPEGRMPNPRGLDLPILPPAPEGRGGAAQSPLAGIL